MTRPDLHTAKTLEEPLTISFDRALEVLKHGRINDELGLMRWGSNYTFLVAVTYDDVSFLAIYKPQVGERPLWDFPDGTLYQREIASYVVSEALGWHIVPPTLGREGPRGIGSLQLFIEHDPQRHYFTFDESHEPQLMRFAAFDAIINNADRKGGHCLIDEDERIWGIDHGLTFHSMNKLRTVIWDYAGQELPSDILSDFSQLCGKLDDASDECHQQLSNLLSKAELAALKARLNRLLQSKCYPNPGSGPNRPWPAI